MSLFLKLSSMKIGENWGKLEKIGENWGKLEGRILRVLRVFRILGNFGQFLDNFFEI